MCIYSQTQAKPLSFRDNSTACKRWYLCEFYDEEFSIEKACQQ